MAAGTSTAAVCGSPTIPNSLSGNTSSAAKSERNERPSDRPSRPNGPAGKPEPLVTLETRAATQMPATTRKDTPSSAPSKSYGPAGSPEPVAATLYKLQAAIGFAKRPAAAR